MSEDGFRRALTEIGEVFRSENPDRSPDGIIMCPHGPHPYWDVDIRDADGRLSGGSFQFVYPCSVYRGAS